MLSNKENDDEIALADLKGIWMNCRLNEINNKVCYVITFEEEKKEYSVRIGMYGTDGVNTYEITEFTKLEDNKYKLELYSEGYDGPGGSSPEQTNTLTVDTSNNSLVIYDKSNNKYEYVTDDWSNHLELEEYYNNKFNLKIDLTKFAGTYKFGEKVDPAFCDGSAKDYGEFLNLELKSDGTYTYTAGMNCGGGWNAYGKYAISEDKIYLFNDNCKINLVDGECGYINCENIIELNYSIENNEIIIKSTNDKLKLEKQ